MANLKNNNTWITLNKYSRKFSYWKKSKYVKNYLLFIENELGFNPIKSSKGGKVTDRFVKIHISIYNEFLHYILTLEQYHIYKQYIEYDSTWGGLQLP